MHHTTVDSLKETAAKTLAADLAYNRNEAEPITVEAAITYIEQWYTWNSRKRIWVINF